MGIVEYWNSKDSKIYPLVVDVSGALQQLDRFHYATHEGQAYSIEHEFSLTDTTAQYMEIVVGARAIHMQDRSVSTNVSDVLVEIYHDATITAGVAPVTITPRRFTFTKASTNLVTARTVELVADGTLVAGQVIVYGENGVGNSSSGDGVSSSREVNFPALSVLGVKVQRRSGTGAAKVKLDFGYYEIH